MLIIHDFNFSLLTTLNSKLKKKHHDKLKDYEKMEIALYFTTLMKNFPVFFFVCFFEQEIPHFHFACFTQSLKMR